MDALPVAVFAVNKMACPVYLNHKAHALLSEPLDTSNPRLYEQDLLTSLNIKTADLNHPYPLECFPVFCALRGEKASVDDIALQQGNDTRYFQVSAVPIFDDDGKPAFAVATFMDIGARKKIESQLKWRNLELESLFDQVSRGKEELRALSKRLLTVQEEERRHISRELHDEIGQALTILKIKLQTLPNSQTDVHGALILSPENVQEMVRSIDDTLQQVRNLSVDLRPSVLDDLGLPAALRWYVDRQAQLSGIEIKFQSLSNIDRIASEIETACFRLVQEAIINIIRHSEASRARVLLERDQTGIHLRIVDDGRGFDVSKAYEEARLGRSSGILGMKERVHLLEGKIEILANSGKGVQIQAFFPFPSPENNDRAAK